MILVFLVALEVLAILLLEDHEAQGVPAQIHLVVQGDLVVLLALVNLPAFEMLMMRPLF